MDMGMIRPNQEERRYIRMFERKQAMDVTGLLYVKDRIYIRFHDLYSCSIDDIFVDMVRDIPAGVIKKYLNEEIDAAMYGIEPPMDYDNWLRINSIIA